MFKLEARPQASKFWSYGSPLLALAITVLIGVALWLVVRPSAPSAAPART